MTKEEIIRRHFHGFDDDQWDAVKNEWPFCEIIHILNDFEREEKCTLPIVSGTLLLAEDELNHELKQKPIVDTNWVKQVQSVVSGARKESNDR